MSVSDGSSECDVTADTAVVWSLVGWVSVGWPAERSGGELVVLGKDGVLLLDTVPWLLSSIGVEDWLGEGSEVGVGWDEVLVGGVFPGVGLGEDEDVVSSEERIREEGNWLHDDLGVLSGGLVA